MELRAFDKLALAATVDIGKRLGLDVRGHHIIRSIHTVLVAVPRERLILRIEPPAAKSNVYAASAAATLLAQRNFPCVRLAHPTPLVFVEHFVTVWHQLEILPRQVTARELGELASRLHRLTAGHVDGLRPYTLTREIAFHLGDQLPDIASKFRVLDRQWHAYLAHMPSSKKVLIHGDLHCQNAVWTPTGPVLLDLENVGVGPAFCDLVPTILATRRYGQALQWKHEFCCGYGADPSAEAGFDTIYALYELYVATWCHRFQHISPDVAKQAEIRLGALRGQDLGPWTLV